ncbi:MAG: hypothetical protein AAGI28_09815, partial [Pseudomonadota bacterium]
DYESLSIAGFEVLEFGGGQRAAWSPPAHFRRPARENGDFVGAEGDSNFRLSDALANELGLPVGTIVPWRRGVPDFNAFAVPGPNGHPSSFSVSGLTGDRGS